MAVAIGLTAFNAYLRGEAYIVTSVYRLLVNAFLAYTTLSSVNDLWFGLENSLITFNNVIENRIIGEDSKSDDAEKTKLMLSPRASANIKRVSYGASKDAATEASGPA